MKYYLSNGVVHAFEDDAPEEYYAGMQAVSEREALALVQQQQLQTKPSSCTPAQGLVAIYALKSITEDNILEAIDGIPDDVLRYTAKIGYQRATSWERASPTMQVMAQLLQLTETELDNLFAHAATVQI
ncbi:hypothetical protein DZC30_05005 [Comamonas testosteroni]|uniref:Uncharacterized protein n=1 Tax=Comamonas testosteroni TaxID=285 RepID=A0A373FRX4_COMTE|nr:hypothetical protein [Comamonas testosteroni]RGE46129.1 hypothetical protein DZC30_05005 [Comamonas testosteroni]